MASRLGMFLYPTLTFFFSVVPVSWLSLSSFSDVKLGSPPGTALSFEGVPDRGDELRAAGEAERVEGALTAMESAVDASEVVDAFPPPEVVRSVNADSLGRAAELVDAGGGAAAPLGALIFMRAASWLRDGSLLGCGFWGCSVLDMVARRKRRNHNLIENASLQYNTTQQSVHIRVGFI